jgi:hypothetical protein
LRPGVFNAFASKLSMKLGSELYRHTELSPQVLKSSFFIFEVIAIGKDVAK